MAATMGLASCDNWSPLLEKEGTVQLSDLAVNVTDNSRAGVDVSGYTVKILTSDDVIKGEWLYSEMPEVFSLPVGTNYKLLVYSHEVKAAAWEEPYYKGKSKNFDITENRITRVGTVECVLSNIKVQITFSDKLKSMMSDESYVRVEANSTHLDFGKDETRAAYFEYVENSTTLVATLYANIDGDDIEQSVSFDNVAEGKFYDLTFGVNDDFPVPDDYGGNIELGDDDGITLVLTVNEVNQEGNLEVNQTVLDEVARPDNEDPAEDPEDPTEDPEDPTDPDGPASDTPSTSAITFIPSEDLSLTGNNIPSEFGDESELAPGSKKAIVTINCPGGFAHIEVDIVSPYLTDSFLTEFGLSAHFDLVEPGTYEATLKGFGFAVGDEVKGLTTTDFDITGLVPLLGLSGDDTMVHKFIITVTDELGNTASQTLTFCEQPS